MRLFKALVVVPLWFLIAATAPPPSPAQAPATTPTPIPSPTPAPTPPPTPSPIPTNAYITLDVTAGPPTSTINVSGGSFLANESMSLFWDQDSQVIGSAQADGKGNFTNVKVKPFAGAQPGPHQICFSVPPRHCAGFLLQAATATPSPSPSPSESPSPSPSPSPSTSPTPIPIPVASTNDLDLILKPPLVFLPVAGLLGLIAAVGWWLFTVFPRQQRHLPSASVMHRSSRPTWGPVSGGMPDPAAVPVDEPRPSWPAPPPASFWEQRPTQPEEQRPTQPEQPPEIDG